jgi:hypothetical protein
MKQSKQNLPPKWALKILQFICTPDLREEIEGNILEKYNADLQAFGLEGAKRHFYRQFFSIIKLNLILNLNQLKMKSLLYIKQNPYGLLLLAAMLMIISTTFIQISNVDFRNITMFSLPLLTMLWIIPSILLFLWLLYILTNRYLYSEVITQIHLITTIFTIGLILVMVFIGINPTQFSNDRHELIGNTIQILSLIFISSQLVYVLNIVLGFLMRNKV